MIRNEGMRSQIGKIIICIFCLHFTNSLYANADNSCSEKINSLGIPRNPTTVIEFKYLNSALQEIKENFPNCFPNTSNKSFLNFDSLFSEKTIDNLIDTYPTYQVRQLALQDLKNEISGISYWYITPDSKYSIERAKLYLLQFYVMLKSIELYSQNTSDRNIDRTELENIKDFIFNELRIVESYVKANKFFGVLSEKQHLYVKSRMIKYIKRLKLISGLIQDTEYQSKLDAVIENLK